MLWHKVQGAGGIGGYPGISAFSYVQQVSFGSGLRDITFKPDGSEISTLTYGQPGSTVSYSMGTNFDISTIGSSVDTQGITTSISIDYIDNGNKGMISDFFAREIEIFSLATPYRFSSFTTPQFSKRSTGISQYHARISPDGSRVYWNNSATNQLIQEDVSPAFAIANGTNRQTMSYAETGIVLGWDINSTGEYVLFADNSGILREYPLSTPYDLTTAGSPTTLDVSANVGAPYVARYVDSDTKIIVMDRVANTLTEYGI